MNDRTADPRAIYRNHSNGNLYEVWAEVDHIGDDVEGDETKLVVYAYHGAHGPQFARAYADFHHAFVRDERHQLFKFYGVDTMEALVEAQAKHIERLQSQLPPTVKPAYARVREG